MLSLSVFSFLDSKSEGKKPLTLISIALIYIESVCVLCSESFNKNPEEAEAAWTTAWHACVPSQSAWFKFHYSASNLVTCYCTGEASDADQSLTQETQMESWLLAVIYPCPTARDTR